MGSMKHTYAKKAGFTIVEVLIVIVVIAVLVAISTVAYMGIQQQARESRVMTQLLQVRKQMELNRIEQGSWPWEAAVAQRVASGQSYNSAVCREVMDYIQYAYNADIGGIAHGSSTGCSSNGTLAGGGSWTFSVNVSASGLFIEGARVEINSTNLSVVRRVDG